jgi:hypothetical protein
VEATAGGILVASNEFVYHILVDPQLESVVQNVLVCAFLSRFRALTLGFAVA